MVKIGNMNSETLAPSGMSPLSMPTRNAQVAKMCVWSIGPPAVRIRTQAARGTLVPVRLASDTSGLKAPEGTLRVCLINQNITHDERLAIDPGRKFTAASMLQLTGPAIDATAGVTLGGASVDEFERWAPPMNEEVRLTGREIFIDVPAASAALVSSRG